MAEYIEREALLASLAIEDYPWTEFDDAFKIVQNEPPADVAPVKHGKWIFDAENYEWNCSGCHDWPIDGSFDDERTNYCPNCGAKMDGED